MRADPVQAAAAAHGPPDRVRRWPASRFGGRSGPLRCWLTTVTGAKPAYAMLNIRALARGAAAPLRSPRKTAAPAAFAVRE